MSGLRGEEVQPVAVAAENLVSDREMSLLVMIARGYTTDLAARQLHLSRHTVGELISRLLERFECKNRAELVAYCYVHGLLSVGAWPPGRNGAEPEGGL